jgi:hypothetical protein
VSKGCTSWNKFGDGSRRISNRLKKVRDNRRLRNTGPQLSLLEIPLFCYIIFFCKHFMNIYAVCSLKFYKRTFDSYENYWKMFHSRTANVCGRICALEIGESGKTTCWLCLWHKPSQSRILIPRTVRIPRLITIVMCSTFGTNV